MKYAFTDTETTGVDEQNCSIFQLTTYITDSDGNVLDKIDLKMRPHADDNLEAEALEKTNKTKDELFAHSLSQEQGFKQYTDFLNKHVNRFDSTDKLIFAAYNSDFDERFIRKFFYNNNDDFYGSYFWNPSLCLMKEAVWRLREIRNLIPKFQLATICQLCSIEWDEEKAHEASYDVMKTIKLYQFFND